MRPLSSQWIPTELISSPASPYSIPASISISLQLFLGSLLTAFLSFSKHISSLKAKFFPCPPSQWGSSKESLSLLYKTFLRPLVAYASPGWFPFLSVIKITKLERFHRAASRAISGCFSASPIPVLISLRLFYLPYESPRLISLSHLMSRLFVSLFLLSYFRFDQIWSETKTLQIILESFCVYSHNSCFLLLPPGGLFLLVLSLLLGICLPSLWSSPFLFQAPTLISLSLAKVWLLLILTLSHFTIWYSGQTALFLLAKAALWH